MKNWSIFVASDQDNNNLVWCRDFCFYIRRALRLWAAYSYGFYTARYEVVLVDKGIARPFFRASYFNFSCMTKTRKNCGTANHSTRTSTWAHDTSESLYSKFLAEKRAKNKAYGYILSRGLLRDYIAYSRGELRSLESIDERVELILKNC